MAQAHVCDAAIIGAGVNGLAIAYELCKRNKKVILIDKETIGAGASGACDDMILLQSKKPGIVLQMTLRSLELYAALKQELPCDIEFENRGGTILIENAEQLAVMEEFVKRQKNQGLEVDIIDAARLKKIQPFVADDIIASTYSAKDSQVNPLSLMKALYLGASAKGMKFLRNAAPAAIKDTSLGWKITLQSGDTVESDVVINAAGAWAATLCALIDVHVPVTPKKGQVLVTEPLPPVGATNVWSAHYIASKLNPDMVSQEEGALADKKRNLGLGFAFTATSDGNYLVGSTRENAGFDRTTHVQALSLLASQVHRFFPALGSVSFIRSFAGLRPSTPDGMPILGEIPGKPGFFIAAGHEGDGIALAPVTGALMADSIEGRKTFCDIGILGVQRFLLKDGI